MKFISALDERRINKINTCRIETWKEYADSVYRGLSGKCIEDSRSYNFAVDIQPVLEYALKNISRLSRIERIFDQIKEELRYKVHTLFKIEPDVLIVLYLGLCNGAGWATKIEDQRVILLGAEKILELNWDTEERMRALVYHELGHIWHDCEGFLWCDYESPGKKAIFQLYREGVAMVFEQILCQDMDYYHQGAEWSKWCKEHLPEIKAAYMKRIQHQESVQAFYGDWNEYLSYSDTGYYLGAQFIRYLMNEYTFNEIACLSYDEIYKEFEMYAFGK